MGGMAGEDGGTKAYRSRSLQLFWKSDQTKVLARMPLPAPGEIAADELRESCLECARHGDEAITVTRTRAHKGSPQNEEPRILAGDLTKVKLQK